MNSTASWRATWTSNLIVPTGVKKSHYYWKCMFSWIHSHIPRVEDCSIESRAVWTPLRGKASSHHWWYQLPSLSPNLHDKIHNYIFTYMNENVYMKINTYILLTYHILHRINFQPLLHCHHHNAHHQHCHHHECFQYPQLNHFLHHGCSVDSVKCMWLVWFKRKGHFTYGTPPFTFEYLRYCRWCMVVFHFTYGTPPYTIYNNGGIQRWINHANLLIDYKCACEQNHNFEHIITDWLTLYCTVIV